MSKEPELEQGKNLKHGGGADAEDGIDRVVHLIGLARNVDASRLSENYCRLTHRPGDSYLDQPADHGKHGNTAVLELCRK